MEEIITNLWDDSNNNDLNLFTDTPVMDSNIPEKTESKPEKKNDNTDLIICIVLLVLIVGVLMFINYRNKNK